MCEREEKTRRRGRRADSIKCECECDMCVNMSEELDFVVKMENSSDALQAEVPNDPG